MKRTVFVFLVVTLGIAACAWSIVAFEHGFAHFLGIDTQTSQNYDFVSGVGPMFVTAVGYGGLIAALIGKFNCHQEGCWRIGKHHINGSPWCNMHHDRVRPVRSERELLERIVELLEAAEEVRRH